MYIGMPIQTAFQFPAIFNMFCNGRSKIIINIALGKRGYIQSNTETNTIQL